MNRDLGTTATCLFGYQGIQKVIGRFDLREKTWLQWQTTSNSWLYSTN